MFNGYTPSLADPIKATDPINETFILCSDHTVVRKFESGESRQFHCQILVLRKLRISDGWRFQDKAAQAIDQFKSSFFNPHDRAQLWLDSLDRHFPSSLRRLLNQFRLSKLKHTKIYQTTEQH